MRIRDWTLQYNLLWASFFEEESESLANLCICPDGYTLINGECTKISTLAAGAPSAGVLLENKRYAQYSQNGMRVYNEGFNKSGIGDDYTVYQPLNDFWYNYNLDVNKGVMNRCAVWTAAMNAYQYIGFSICLNIPVDKVYYIGLGVDNFAYIKIDGEYKVSMPPMENALTFRHWFMYPVHIRKGVHVIEVVASNVSSIAAIGVEIYDLGTKTLNDLFATTNDAQVNPYLIFSTKNLFGTYTNLGTNGYAIVDNYSLITCDGTPYYRKVEYAACALVSDGYGLFYNWLLTQGTGNNSLTSSDAWDIPTESQWLSLIAYIGGNTVAGGKLKESGNIHWTNNIGATNDYLFNSRGAGIRNSAGVFSDIKNYNRFWTKTEQSLYNAKSITISAGSVAISDAENYLKTFGLSIRLVSNADGIADGQTTIYTGNNGKEYLAVAINGLYWLMYSLQETLFRDLTPIPEITDNTAWSNLTTGALCAYNNNWSNLAEPVVTSISPGDGDVRMAGRLGNFFHTEDGGEIWRSKYISTLVFRRFRISSNGRYQFIRNVTSTATYYKSSDYGLTFATKSFPIGYANFDINSDGQYITAVRYYNSSPAQIQVSNDYGATFTARNTALYYADISISADGRYQAVCDKGLNLGGGYIYISTDYGVTWNQKGGFYAWTCIVISDDGQTIVAGTGTAGNPCFISRDGGETWSPKGPAISVVGAVAMSKSGQHIIISAALNPSDRFGYSGTVVTGYVYVSNDYGETWSTGKVSNISYTELAVSGSGAVMIATPVNNNLGLQYSEDYGNTWKTIAIGQYTAACALNRQ